MPLIATFVTSALPLTLRARSCSKAPFLLVFVVLVAAIFAEGDGGILACFAKNHRVTPREQAILSYVAQNTGNPRISHELPVPIGTVKIRTHHPFEKTGMSNREEPLAAFWAE